MCTDSPFTTAVAQKPRAVDMEGADNHALAIQSTRKDIKELDREEEVTVVSPDNVDLPCNGVSKDTVIIHRLTVHNRGGRPVAYRRQRGRRHPRAGTRDDINEHEVQLRAAGQSVETTAHKPCGWQRIHASALPRGPGARRLFPVQVRAP